MGTMFAGGICGGIYATNSPEACKYVVDYSKSEVVVLEGNRQLYKFSQISRQVPTLRVIVLWGEKIDAALAAKLRIPVYTWEGFLALGAKVPLDEVKKREASIRPGHCASLIYTSGTTGAPKAVMISHDNLTWTSKAITDLHAFRFDRVVSYLPLSHIAAQIVDMHGVMIKGGTIYFAQPDALKGSLVVTLREVRPTFFFGVPRVWEKVVESIAKSTSSLTGFKKMLVTWAQGTGKEKHARSQTGCDGGTPFGYSLAKRLVFNKLKKELGLDVCEGFYSAAAPMRTDTLWYLASLDVPVYEVFGQSECTGPHSLSSAESYKVGYCGIPLESSQNRIDPVTGEFCYRGRHIFMGYMYMPQETMNTLDEAGYLHSGDVAILEGPDDNTAFVKITGRIKELIITAGGENIPPTLIENQMMAACPVVSHCLVIGDGKKFLTMLVSLKVRVDDETTHLTDQLTEDVISMSIQLGSPAVLYPQVVYDDRWKEYIDTGLAKVNAQATSSAQVIQKWRWLPADLSEKAGDLTPTMKVKRKVVMEKYRSLIDAMYDV